MSFLTDYDLLSSSTSHQGGFATVYKVRHKILGYVRAIRVLNVPITGENDPRYTKFLEECKLLLRIGNGGHPNIVRIAQPRLLNHHALVEMEYIEGEDLNDYISQTCKGFIPIGEFFNFAQNISSALSYCHHDIYKFCIDKDVDLCVQDDDNGKILVSPDCEKKLVNKYKIIHNDIHSKNVIRKYDGTFILLDFGLSILDNTVIKSSTRKGGVDEYKAPEKWEDDGILTEQTDIYSFGILLYEMLTGQVPFPLLNKSSQSQIFELKRKHEQEPIPSIAERRKKAFTAIYPNKIWEKDYPVWVESMILKCLEKRKEKRFANAKELHDFLLLHIKNENLNNKEILEWQKKYHDQLFENKSMREMNATQAATIKELNNKVSSFPFSNKGIEEGWQNKTKQLTNDNDKIKNELHEKELKLKESDKELITFEKKLSDVYIDLNKTKVELEKANKRIAGLIKNGHKKSSSLVKVLLIVLFFGIIAFSAGLTNEYWLPQSVKKTILTSFGVPSNTSPAISPAGICHVENNKYTINNKTYVFTGQISGGLPNGWGSSTDDSGSFEGTFRNGLRHGYGKLVFADGGRYIGEFRDDAITGMGTYFFNNNYFYKGEFIDNKLNGKGFYFNPNGEIQTQGTFKNNEFVE